MKGNKLSLRRFLWKDEKDIQGLFGSTPIHMDWGIEGVSISSKSKFLSIRINSLQFIWIENNRTNPQGVIVLSGGKGSACLLILGSLYSQFGDSQLVTKYEVAVEEENQSGRHIE
jgi:hypothetical protein